MYGNIDFCHIEWKIDKILHIVMLDISLLSRNPFSSRHTYKQEKKLQQIMIKFMIFFVISSLNFFWCDFKEVTRKLSCAPNLLSLRCIKWESGLAQWLASRTTDQGVPGSRPGCGTVCCGLEQVTFTHCLVLVKPRQPWTDDWLGLTVTRLETMLCLMC